ncbi:MAG: hypothetical protein FWE01_00290 [Firmicutes bacterium]|nr:hypothetical protein [Bacillota bacterium]
MTQRRKKILRNAIIGLVIVLVIFSSVGAILFTSIRTTYGLDIDLRHVNAIELRWGAGNTEREIIFPDSSNNFETLLMNEAMRHFNRGRRTNMLEQFTTGVSGRERAGFNGNTQMQNTHGVRSATGWHYMMISFATPQWALLGTSSRDHRIVPMDYTWYELDINDVLVQHRPTYAQGIRQMYIPLANQRNRFQRQEILFSLGHSGDADAHSLRYSLSTFANFAPLARFVQSLAVERPDETY